MYAEMKLVGGGVLGTSSETHLKMVWEVFRERNVQFWLVCGASIAICVYVQRRTKNRKLQEGVFVQVKGVFACMQK